MDAFLTIASKREVREYADRPVDPGLVRLILPDTSTCCTRPSAVLAVEVSGGTPLAITFVLRVTRSVTRVLDPSRSTLR